MNNKGTDQTAHLLYANRQRQLFCVKGFIENAHILIEHSENLCHLQRYRNLEYLLYSQVELETVFC